MPLEERLSRFLFLAELHLVGIKEASHGGATYHLEKRSDFEVCPKCATPSNTVYDHRTVHVKDEPIRSKFAVLAIKKRRFFCKTCHKPFTEPISGISKGHRTTERYQRSLLWACDNFSDLKKVRRTYRCSAGFLYKTLYEQLERKRRQTLSYPWPRVIGVDEHVFKRRRNYGGAAFASIIVDYHNRRPFELVEGRSVEELRASLSHIPGRENVHWVNMDLCQPFRAFTRSFFPNAKIVADKFHVVRLLHPALNRRRKEITGDHRKNPIRRLLLRDSSRLEFFERSAMWKWLAEHPDLREIYEYKEAIHQLYRTRGHERAERALNGLIVRMAASTVSEIRTLRKTLMSWRQEILNHFKTGLTNARVEGFNNKAMIVRTRAYGYRSFQNYRLRVLNA
jgi:transposase